MRVSLPVGAIARNRPFRTLLPSTMHVRQIDPRDQFNEDVAPTYRVFFWDGPAVCDEYELVNTDLDGVLAWIEASSAGRSHSLWITTRVDGEPRGVRLRGIDPPAQPETWPAWAREVR